jgi:hypothetical protein
MILRIIMIPLSVSLPGPIAIAFILAIPPLAFG